jgi:ferredoxin
VLSVIAYARTMALRIHFLPSGRSVRVERGATLHDAVRRAGLPIASACGADGVCARCAVEVAEGGDRLPPESPEESDLKARNRVAAHHRLACRVAPTDDVTLTTPYW